MLTSKTTIAKEIKDLQLSIQFSLDGFSFCIKSISSQNTLSFTKYSFGNGLQNPQIILKEIASIFETDTNLQQDFEKYDQLVVFCKLLLLYHFLHLILFP